MAQIDESTLTKGQLRKLNALRKSVGDEVGERAFAEWLALQGAAGPKPDGNAATIVDTLWPMVRGGHAGDPAWRLPGQARAGPHRRGAGEVVEGRFVRRVSMPSRCCRAPDSRSLDPQIAVRFRAGARGVAVDRDAEAGAVEVLHAVDSMGVRCPT